MIGSLDERAAEELLADDLSRDRVNLVLWRKPAVAIFLGPRQFPPRWVFGQLRGGSRNCGRYSLSGCPRGQGLADQPGLQAAPGGQFASEGTDSKSRITLAAVESTGEPKYELGCSVLSCKTAQLVD